MRVTNRLKLDYESLLKNKGELYFYNYIVGSGFMARTDFERSELLLLDTSEAFFTLFRQTGNENYFVIGKVIRRAAHKLYRDNMKNRKDFAQNSRFLNLI